MMSGVIPATSGYVNVSYVRYIASTKFAVSEFRTLYCMGQILFTVWDHGSKPLDHHSVGLTREHRLSGAH